MRLEIEILIALVLDALMGDPRWLPHPVRWLGRVSLALEPPARRLLPARAAGIVTASLVVTAAGGASHALLSLAATIHWLVADIVAIILLYTTFAAGDLALHARGVLTALGEGDLARARERAGLMVGRDTRGLDEQGLVRATVESVAENTVDGVTAPLFYASVFGPVGAMVYKAVNTLDSTFGYRDQRYLRFGWASARLDDAANWLPARLTALLIPIAAAAAGQRAMTSLRVLIRDGRNHSSPNSGLSEAAVAGALGVQLGGASIYRGQSIDKPTIGDPLAPLERDHIRQSIVIMRLTTLLAAALFLPLGYLIRWAVLTIQPGNPW
ncbi:MAG: cobalamin biosynthesis protein CobD [Deltaproteobacteria bacterium]|nr:cobalamin biosynthesis protein CobD [Deltaproteobacteria bacterium]